MFLFQMDYGLWNLHGGFWASNNPCSGDSVSRSLYTTVSAGTSGHFHGCAGEEGEFFMMQSKCSVSPKCGMHFTVPPYPGYAPIVLCLDKGNFLFSTSQHYCIMHMLVTSNI